MTRLSATLLSLPLVFAATFSAQAYTGERLESRVPVKMVKATAIALKVRPGQITDRELERERGGLRYSFDIRAHGVTYEVGVDAMNGRVLENAPEGAHPD